MIHFVTVDLAIATLLLGAFLSSLPWLNRDSPHVRRVIYWLFAYLLVRYAVWRATSTLPPPELHAANIFALLYFAFEMWTFKQGLNSFKLYVHFKDRSAEANEHHDWYVKQGRLPVVDYLIPTYNEDHAILERAIVGALSQDYPRTRIWVLDDGRRDWLRALAEEKGVGYLTRPTNAGFKAGNLNNALQHLASLPEPSEFFAVLDCDFLAKPEFVTRTLTLMWDESVAIVQSKQIYYNLDPFQYALPGGRYLPDWQRFAFDFVAPCLDVYSAQTCCGTCFLARTSSFEAIGGMPTESVAEDALASYALNERGLRTIYLAETLSYGIVAEGLREFLTQCGRWCFGRAQHIHSRWGGRSPKKSPMERLSFITGNVAWGLFTLARLLQMWLPPFYLLFGFELFPIHGTNEGFAWYFIEMWVFNVVVSVWLTRGASLPIVIDSRQLLWASVILRATYRAIIKSSNYKFDVTDKGALRDRTQVHWKPLKWLILVGGFTIAGLAYRALGTYPPGAGNYDAFAYFWSYYNLLALATAAAVCVEPPQRRAEQRFETDEIGQLTVAGTASEVTLLNLSVSGALLKAKNAIEGDILDLDVREVGTVSADVVRAAPDGETAVRFRSDGEQRARLIRKLYSEAYVRPVVRANVARVFRGILSNALLWNSRVPGRRAERSRSSSGSRRHKPMKLAS